MNIQKMKDTLQQQLQRPEWSFHYDREKDKLRIEDQDSGRGVTLSLPGLVHKYEQEGKRVVDEVVYHVREVLTTMHEEMQLTGQEKNIYPVIRSTSFPEETKSGKTLIFDEHTAETRIYYALDAGKSYRLIDEEMLKKENWAKDRVAEIARFNIRSLSQKWKEDEVADNKFYFINENDGYDASRILNLSLLEEMFKDKRGDLAVAVPHQDVLICCDIVNQRGYDVLGQMAMSFFSNGRVPITPLPFIYENGKLEPIFIMAKKKGESE